MIELWAADGDGFHLWVRCDGMACECLPKVDAEFEFPATVKEAFGMLRKRGLDVDALAVASGHRIIRRGPRLPNPQRRKAS